MRTLIHLCVLVGALVLIWPSASAAAAGVFDVGLAARSLVAGFLLGLMLNWLFLYIVVHNRIVESDRRRDMDRVNDMHDKRKMRVDP